ncbi:hypothetical protein ACFWY6_24840 [Streptomyces sp. NPDC059037]|uniref:hypothetical protein n=1 Tax=Streptomyces sp. NPDC059037 TaxID=3346710 RepID=UPI0036D1710C
MSSPALPEGEDAARYRRLYALAEARELVAEGALDTDVLLRCRAADHEELLRTWTES